MTVPVATERLTMTWPELGVAARSLATEILYDGFRPELILGVARGGLLPAGAVGYALDVKNTAAISVEFYTGIDQRLPAPVVLPPVPDLAAFGSVLIVDDVADTGGTLALVQAFCRERIEQVRTAVLFEKPRSAVRCDYVWQRTDCWIDFPWSVDGPVSI